jgi:hypothetical protein
VASPTHKAPPDASVDAREQSGNAATAVPRPTAQRPSRLAPIVERVEPDKFMFVFGEARDNLAVTPSDTPDAKARRGRRPQRKRSEITRARVSLTARVVAFLRSSGAASNSEELQANCRVFSTEELREVLDELVREGRVERTGEARATRYRWIGGESR